MELFLNVSISSLSDNNGSSVTRVIRDTIMLITNIISNAVSAGLVCFKVPSMS